MTIDPADVAERVAATRARIERAGGVDVELIAVTKTFPAEAITAAQAAGCRAIGENYAQELLAKLAELPAEGRPEVHFIGRLQRNKLRSLAGSVDVYQTVERRSLVDELARRVPGARCFLQVNVAGEAHKGGCEPAALDELLAAAVDAGLRVEGLMAIGPLAAPEAARPGFRLLRRLADERDLVACSMGMSADLEVTVEEGATHVRVGSALFGERVRLDLGSSR